MINGAVGVFAPVMMRSPHLSSLLGVERVLFWPHPGRARELSAVVGWGNKFHNVFARGFAKSCRLPYVRSEDGFLRSVGLGRAGEPPLSVVLDDIGIYYDATRPSRLERILAGPPAGEADPLLDPVLLERARHAMAAIAQNELTKYNNSLPDTLVLPSRRQKRVLVIDQTRGDLSIRYGMASARTFQDMLVTAIGENPDADIVVKVHPDVMAGKRRGHLERIRDPRITIIGQPINPIALLRQVDRVYVVTSQLGFEALTIGVPVTCFGAPFYSGWGVTDDRAHIARRQTTRSVEQLFAAAYLLYARYIDPDTGRPGTLEQVIDHLVLQRQMFTKNAGQHVCVGVPQELESEVRAHLASPGNTIEFKRGRSSAVLEFSSLAECGSRVIAWDTTDVQVPAGVPLWRMKRGAEPHEMLLERQGSGERHTSMIHPLTGHFTRYPIKAC